MITAVMRGACVMLTSLGLLPTARADVSIGDAAANSSRPAWVTTCEAALEDARRALASSSDPRLLDARVRFDESQPEASPDCEHDRYTEVVLSMSSGFDASVWTDHGVDKSHAWTQDKRWWKRHEAGRATAVVKIDPTHPITTARLRQALDACIAAAPTSDPAPPATNDAETAANELERACVIEGSAIGYSARPGKTNPRLARVMALGSRALPLLLRLAHARNAAARAAAAMGLAKLDGKPAQEALEQLKQDHSRVGVRSGCVPRSRTVGEIAEEPDLDL